MVLGVLVVGGNVSSELTIEQLSKVVPKGLRSNITTSLLDTINTIAADEIVREAYRDNLLNYTTVLKDGKYKLTSYIDAVRYISFKSLGSSNVDSYVKTFPDRYQRLVEKGTSNKDISSYVAMYNGNKLVQMVAEQAMVPVAILNADLYQKALNKQAELMGNPDVSFKVQSDAANSLLTHLKLPETTKVELDIGLNADKSIQDLRATMAELAVAQLKSIEGGVSVKDIAHSTIVASQ